MEVAIFVALLAIFVGGPILLWGYLYLLSQRPQHSVIRAHPYLGWFRYLLEKLGPEFRQYWFDHDTQGKPFSRSEFLAVVWSAKYRGDLISFGSKRDFQASGFYLSNSMFPLLTEELSVDHERTVVAKRYQIQSEGLLTRKENLVEDDADSWLYPDEDAIVVGSRRLHPWKLKRNILRVCW